MNVANSQPNGDLNLMQLTCSLGIMRHGNYTQTGMEFSCAFSSFLCSASVNTFLSPTLYFAYTTIACPQK